MISRFMPRKRGIFITRGLKKKQTKWAVHWVRSAYEDNPKKKTNKLMNSYGLVNFFIATKRKRIFYFIVI